MPDRRIAGETGAYQARGWVVSTRVSTNRYDLISAATEEEAADIAAAMHAGEGQVIRINGMTEVPYCDRCGSYSAELVHSINACSGRFTEPAAKADEVQP